MITGPSDDRDDDRTGETHERHAGRVHAESACREPARPLALAHDRRGLTRWC